MTTAINSVDILRVEIKREEAELARDKSQLEELEKSAKAAKTERKKQSKNVCRLFVASNVWPDASG